MAKDSIADWSTTATDNTDIGGIGIQGTNSVSNMDNAVREMMAQVADLFAVDVGLSPEQQEQARENIDALARDGSDWSGDANAAAAFRALIGAAAYVSGDLPVGLSNAVGDADHDILFPAIILPSDDAFPVPISLPAWTKRFDATFAEGDGEGGMASADALPTSGTIYLFGIAKADGTADWLASTSTTPTLPGDFVHKAFYAALPTDGSANIRGVIHRGNRFELKDRPLDLSIASAGAVDVPVPLSVPAGALIVVFGTVMLISGVNTSILLRSPLADSQAASGDNHTVRTISTGASRPTNDFAILTTDGTIIRRRGEDDVNNSLYIRTHGWQLLTRRLA